MGSIEKINGLLDEIIAIEKNPQVTQLLAEFFDSMLEYISEGNISSVA